MEVEYRRDLGHNYVILGLQDRVDTASYQVRMVLSNDIEGLLGCSIRGVDGRSMFCYEITSRQSLKALYEHGTSGQGIMIRLYEAVFAVMEQLQHFLLDADGLILEPELIFFSPGKDKVSFCFFPEYKKDIRQSLRELMEYLLPKIDHQNPEAVMAGYGLYRKIMEENCDFEEMRSVLLAAAGTREGSSASKHSGGPSSFMEKPTTVPEDKEDRIRECERQKILDMFFEDEEEEIPFWKRSLGILVVVGLTAILILVKYLAMPGWFFLGMLLLAAAGGVGYAVWRVCIQEKVRGKEVTDKEPMHEKGGEDNEGAQFERSSFFEERELNMPLYGETEILAREGQETFCARLEGTVPGRAEEVTLGKEMTLFGKMSETVDVVLDSPAASRIHARIFRDGERYFLEDLNSRNGSYVNAQTVSMGNAALLRDGDEVRFGDLKYIFRIDGMGTPAANKSLHNRV